MHIVVQQLSDEQKQDLGIFKWPVWTKEVSIFDWQYDDAEDCYILEGEVEILGSDGEKTSFRAGDYVSFPKGLVCTWIVKKAVRKHYRFH